MFIFLFFISLSFAEGRDIRSLAETTYTRDNTYCQIGYKKIQIQIRSDASHTEPKEKKYGEYIFIYPNDKPQLLPLNQDKLNSYRLFEGTNSLCTKSFGYRIDTNKIAILFLKENRPFMDKLSFQIVNTKTFEVENVIDTEYMTDKTELSTEGFTFRTFVERQALEMGVIKIKDIDHNFQDLDFPIWMKYSLNGFEVSPQDSFQNFQWKSYFKDEKDFYECSGWNAKEKKFKNSILYFAVNHELKKECILLSPDKIPVIGSESGWRCNQSP